MHAVAKQIQAMAFLGYRTFYSTSTHVFSLIFSYYDYKSNIPLPLLSPACSAVSRATFLLKINKYQQPFLQPLFSFRVALFDKQEFCEAFKCL